MPRIRVFTVAPLLALTLALGNHQRASDARGEDQNIQAVRAVLEAQVTAWNRGDVAGYMEGYAKGDATTFVSDDTVTRGWETVLARYKTRYGTRAKMGTLAFSDLEFKPLGDSYILALGRWQLTREADSPHGRFTLIFHHAAAGWRIIHDHTSSAS